MSENNDLELIIKKSILYKTITSYMGESRNLYQDIINLINDLESWKESLGTRRVVEDIEWPDKVENCARTSSESFKCQIPIKNGVLIGGVQDAKVWNECCDAHQTAYANRKTRVVTVEDIAKIIEKTLKSSCTCHTGEGIICVGCFYKNDLAKAIHALFYGEMKVVAVDEELLMSDAKTFLKTYYDTIKGKDNSEFYEKLGLISNYVKYIFDKYKVLFYGERKEEGGREE